MRKALAILILVVAVGGVLFAFYPRLSALVDDDGAAYHQVADVQGDRVRIDRDGKRETLSVATFAGGCFWCVEDGLEIVPGVLSAVSGYSGGTEPNPTYEQVAFGQTSYTESVQVYFDPAVISYEGLLQAFWRVMDPTDNDGQFSDRGKQYRPVIFYHSEEQREAAERSRSALDKSGRFPDPVIIPIEPYTNFYMAEDYHQDFSRKNPLHYVFYTHGSGRGPFVEKIWGKDRKLDYSKFRSDVATEQKTATSPTN